MWSRICDLSPPGVGNTPMIVLQTAINVGLPMLEAFTFGPGKKWVQE